MRRRAQPPPPWQSVAAAPSEVLDIDGMDEDLGITHEEDEALAAQLAAAAAAAGGVAAVGASGEEAAAIVAPATPLWFPPAQMQQGAPAAGGVATKPPPMTAFGRAMPVRQRDSPYGGTLEEAQAVAADAEALLVLTQDFPADVGASGMGGLPVKIEPTSA